MALEELFHRLEAFDDALGIVHAVDADTEEGRFNPQFP
jgi:hypothetical protein